MRNRSPVRANDKRLAQLRALADPTRLRILELLAKKGGCSCAQVGPRAAGLCVCDLQRELRLTQPTITHHLRVLRDAGLVECVRLGPWLYCRRLEAALQSLGAAVTSL